MKVLILDNYDSFTFNLVQYIQQILRQQVEVFRNDAIELQAVAQYDAVVLSPGPGIPSEAGIMPALIRQYAPAKPILGVCLGHQAIGEAFGATLENMQEVYHGISTAVHVTEQEEPLFQGLPASFSAGRYHSWAVQPANLPDSLVVTAVDDRGAIMAMRHRRYNVHGLQFHPESIMTSHGLHILDNFFTLCVPMHPTASFYERNTHQIV